MMQEGMELKDRWGYQVSTSSQACVSAINSYYHQVLSYGRERSVILEAVAHDKNCVLANILAAHFLHSSASSRALTYFDAAKSHLEHATLYEKLVFDTISYLLFEDRDDDVAVELHSKLLKEFPRDLVSLKRAQVMCFYMGLPGRSLSLVQQVLPHNEEENYIYGMLAFPLLELGQMEDAEKAARRGFEINKLDSWAQHAVVQLNVLEVYLNAAGLLLRLYVRGELDIIGDRLRILAECLTNQAYWYLEWHFDVLIVWALAKTGEISEAEDLLNGLKDRFLRMTKKKQQQMQRGMMLAEALYAYGKGDDRRGLELLDPDFDATDYKIIGASDEQVDVFNEVWYNMLLNSGEVLRERGYKLANKPEEGIANEKATALESRYFN
ncbi:hypothetical protein Fmac_003324 [Flemingia macrophylla]|uniref:Tetratricopeptide repeat protein 38 n=1 Tax=Flemingia macrophylla TaxID=520843 RepID=A0ABD1NMF6_9FABA